MSFYKQCSHLLLIKVNSAVIAVLARINAKKKCTPNKHNLLCCAEI